MKDRYLKPKEVAETLGISVQTARARMPEMPGCINIGGGKNNQALRVPESGLEAWRDEKIVTVGRPTWRIPRRKRAERKGA